MKKLIVLFIAIWLVGAFGLKAEENSVSILGGIGWGASKFKNINVTLGSEVKLTKKISVVGSFDYFFAPEDEQSVTEKNAEQISKIEDKSEAWVIGTSLKYKMGGSFFMKAGLAYSKFKSERISHINENSWSTKIDSRKGFGLCGGVGFDFYVSRKTGLQIGMDVNVGNGYSWLKTYALFSCNL